MLINVDILRQVKISKFLGITYGEGPKLIQWRTGMQHKCQPCFSIICIMFLCNNVTGGRDEMTLGDSNLTLSTGEMRHQTPTLRETLCSLISHVHSINCQAFRLQGN